MLGHTDWQLITEVSYVLSKTARLQMKAVHCIEGSVAIYHSTYLYTPKRLEFLSCWA